MQIERELPETAALLRLSGLEMSDCMAEITGLGSDLSSGLRSTAQMATMTEAGMRQGVQGVQVRACVCVCVLRWMSILCEGKGGQENARTFTFFVKEVFLCLFLLAGPKAAGWACISCSGISYAR